jgi:hypothetical protein
LVLWCAIPFAAAAVVGLRFVAELRLLWIVLLVFSVAAVGTAAARGLERLGAARAERAKRRTYR